VGVFQKAHHFGKAVFDDVMAEDVFEFLLRYFDRKPALNAVVLLGGDPVDPDVTEEQLVRALCGDPECQALPAPEKLALQGLRRLARVDGFWVSVFNADAEFMHVCEVGVLIQPLAQDLVCRELPHHQRAELWGAG